MSNDAIGYTKGLRKLITQYSDKLPKPLFKLVLIVHFSFQVTKLRKPRLRQ